MDAVPKALHFVALCLMLGGPVFWMALWRVLDAADVMPLTPRVWQRVRRGTLLGAVIFVLSGYAEALRAASQVIDPMDMGIFWQFLVTTRYGHMTLLKSLLTPVLLASFFLLPGYAPRLARLCTVLSGLALLMSISLASHAAARPGLAPVLSDVVHLCSVVIWGGGLLYMALLPWAMLRQDMALYRRVLWKLPERFSNAALVCVILLLASGAVMTFLHVYGLAALSSTPYGRTLTRKIVLLLLALGIAAWQLLVLSPDLKRQARAFVPARAHALLARWALLVRMEAVVFLGALVCAALLTTLPPAERPAQVTQGSWEQTLDDWRVRLTMQPRDDRGHVQFDVLLEPLGGQEIAPDTRLLMHLRMRDHDMGTSRQAATPVAPGQFTVPGLISMAGTWQAEITLAPPQAAALSTTFDFEAATGTLEQDRNRRLEFAAVLASPESVLSGILGLLLGALAVLTLWASRSGRMPLWATPFGLFLMACGGFLVGRVLLVDAYPTTYHRNPLPYSTEVISAGRDLFQRHCTACHGHEGRGDGPAAAALNPRPADLTAAHVDDHTDGDLFWWLTYGIAGTAMPGWDAQLTDAERWMVVHYLRSLRRGPS